MPKAAFASSESEGPLAPSPCPSLREARIKRQTVPAISHVGMKYTAPHRTPRSSAGMHTLLLAAFGGLRRTAHPTGPQNALGHAVTPAPGSVF